MAGRVLEIKKPSLALVHRNADTYHKRTRINCNSSKIKRDQDIKAILDEKDRHFIHYRFVFPFKVDHRVFNEKSDGDLEVHRFNVSVVYESTHPKNMTANPLVELTVAWRVAKHGATDTSSAAKPTIDYNMLLN